MSDALIITQISYSEDNNSRSIFMTKNATLKQNKTKKLISAYTHENITKAHTVVWSLVYVSCSFLVLKDLRICKGTLIAYEKRKKGLCG